MFGASWDHGEATIVARSAKYSSDGSTATHEFVADIRPSEAAPFRATIHEPTIATDFWPPNVGDVVSVLIKSKDNKVKFDKDDQRLSVKAYEARTKQAFADVQNQPLGTPVASNQPWRTAGSSTGGALPDSVIAKLSQLGITPGAPIQVLGSDSAQAQAILAAFGGGSVAADGSASFAGASAAVPTPEMRLARIAALRQQGLLTEAEYATQRERIISEL